MSQARVQTAMQGLEGLGRRLSARLFEPSPAITDLVERRHARLLCKLQVVFAIDCLMGALQTHKNEIGPIQRNLPIALGVATLVSLVCYAISRTRHARLSIWILVAVFDCICPAAIIGAGDAAPFHVFMNIAMMLQGIMVVSTMSSTRATWLTGLLAFAIAIGLRASVGTEAWGVPFRQAMVFMLTSVTLIIVLSVHRAKIEQDRARELRTRNEELEALRRTLEEKVIERTAALRARNADMRFVLDNVRDGIFTVDSTGVIASERSAMLQRWFGAPEPQQHIYRYFAGFAPDFAERLELEWSQVVDDLLPVELALAQLPNSFVSSERHYRVSYEPTSTDGPVRFLVVVSDVTGEVERANAQRDRQESLGIFEHATENRSAFLTFVDEGTELVARAFSDGASLPDRKRALHTLKGNAGLFGLTSVAELCHRAETALAEGGDFAAEAARVRTRWARFSKEVAVMLGSHRRTIEVTPERLEQLVEDTKGAPRAELARALRELAFEPAEKQLAQFAEQARRLSERHAKKTTIEIRSDDLRLDGRIWSPVWSTIAHAIRNAIHHGLELPEERLAAGKSEQGRLVLSARRSNGSVVLEVKDDGRGINWERVRDKCIASGIDATSRADLVRGLFTDGVSTAVEVTELSGRGIGMGALLAAAQALGGTVDVQSECGQGTLVQVVVPRNLEGDGGQASAGCL